MNLNHFIVSGNCTRDPEMRTVGADKCVVSFTLAHNTKFKGADGEMKEECSFIDCEVWGRQGEVAAQYLKKGSMAIVEGSIKQDNWTDKEGQKRSKLKLRVDKVHLMPRGDSLIGRDNAADITPAAGTATRAPMRPLAPAGASASDDLPPLARSEHEMFG